MVLDHGRGKIKAWPAHLGDTLGGALPIQNEGLEVPGC